ncbi:thioesterase [Sinomicrobium pectinilyticum]|uniref:Thioesterase n=1 Tax=Sinomicrobium pectinilyticum TaxID=1084421 RepID=A0A3N0EYU8_SINP1|nr:acyl-CoA thioesterase [Sinomicrobium pectinilyticum]RNL93011.1 thioesterase [Sinomicrobium pectinilyticum]
MYFKEFDIRWSDIDANRHLANSAYINFMSHTRMSFLIENGLTQKELAKHRIGPVVFYEHIYYFREVFAGRPVKVSLELAGMSKDGSFFEFHHNFFDERGRNFAHCEMMGAWIDMETRKLRGLPSEFIHILESLPETEDFKVLTKEDTRKYGKVPRDLDL